MDFHTDSMSRIGTGERIVGGRASGLIGLDEEVEFEARHLLKRRRLRARITAFDRPKRFVDVQVRGDFKSLTHEHTFEPLPDGCTRVTDRIAFDAGYGPLGLVIERLVIAPHLRRIVSRHQANLKAAIESGDDARYSSSP